MFIKCAAAVGEKLACQTEEISAADLDFKSFRASFTASLEVTS